ncbi:MAG: SEC-C domain-containing protein, partial [Acidimicrobiales bacterium]|nr:SEC-C domain-containing protein [Acidimicrobiales bacterium]
MNKSATYTPLSKMRPNDPCFCGSGQKFKRCHK